MQEYRAPKSIHKAGDALRYLLLHRNVESNRTRRKGPDFLSLFVVIFAVQNIIPGMVISFLLSQYARPPDLQNELFDRIYQHISPIDIFLSAMMSLSFILALYIFYHKLYS